MNIAKIALCISALVLSLNVFAFENPENAKVNSHVQITAVHQVSFEQENRQNTLVATNHTMTQSSIEVQEVDFFTKFCISLMIIMAYWLYWLKNYQ